MDLVKARKLTKSYGKKQNVQQVLKGIDLDVQAGEFVGIMGASGSGKTTLLNVLCSIDTPTSGIVEINGHALHEQSSKKLAQLRRTEMGFIFQDYNLLDTLTVKENILLPLAVNKIKKDEAESRCVTLMKQLGIEELKNKYPNEISGGQKQRTAAARALIMKPSIIFGDEPTGALDSKSATSLLESLEALNKAYRVTIMMVTHDPVAASYCNRVLFLKDGSIYTELYKGDQTHKQFFAQIMNTQAVLGGDLHEL
ncbi:ABC transporter ATP-binding protein [Kurthia gibsonii]|uniref:ABC transporter ATP-binding protein n=1 Tax=Kurthia gibsonii TaxID=33946 RepID=UPI0011447577|nr:ABC transporter ATP-binding protein [Kurthia gibsonii]GED20059.1 bacitracin export ATP-binding protein BceA [Kurthia gibsonii]